MLSLASCPLQNIFPIYIDHSALTRETIIVSAGELGHSIEISAKDLADFVEADFADLKEN